MTQVWDVKKTWPFAREICELMIPFQALDSDSFWSYSSENT